MNDRYGIEQLFMGLCIGNLDRRKRWEDVNLWGGVWDTGVKGIRQGLSAIQETTLGKLPVQVGTKRCVLGVRRLCRIVQEFQ